MFLLQAMPHAHSLPATVALETVGQAELLFATGNRALLLSRLGLRHLGARRSKMPVPRHIRVLVRVESYGLLTDGTHDDLHRAMSSRWTTMGSVGEVLLTIKLLARIALEGQEVQLEKGRSGQEGEGEEERQRGVGEQQERRPGDSEVLPSDYEEQ